MLSILSQHPYHVLTVQCYCSFQEYRDAVSRLSTRSGDFYEAVAADARSREAFSTGIILHELLRGLPEVPFLSYYSLPPLLISRCSQIVFTLRAVRQPSTIPRSLASLALITQTTQSFAYSLLALADETGGIGERLQAVRGLYEVIKIPNQVRAHVHEKARKRKAQDDNDHDMEDTRGLPFPEDSSSLAHGVGVEFRNVSFAYPGSFSTPSSEPQWALHNVSFTIQPGQLCVIVGNNGSGKSTILKLLSRLYDPTEGIILLGGHDIRTLRLSDLRKAVSVLFQDYTVFPLSVSRCSFHNAHSPDVCIDTRQHRHRRSHPPRL